MKKIYYMMLLALLTVTITSCRDSWDSPYYIDDVVGSWTSEYGRDYYGDYEITGYDVVNYQFYSNYTGRYTFYSSWGLTYVDFDWDTYGDRISIWYADGDYENLYYGFDNYGYLILSTDYRFREFTAYRPGGYYYKQAEGDAKVSGKQDSEIVKIKSVSRGIKQRVTTDE